MKIKTIIMLLLFSLAAAAAAGCAGPSAKTPKLTIAAASDLKGSLDKIAKKYEEQTGRSVEISFGSSGLFARQIENGAPYDLYLSANKAYVDELKAKKYVVDAAPLARGRLVLVGKATTQRELPLPAIKKIVIADPKHAPYGKAGEEALRHLGDWPTLKEKLVIAENASQAFEIVKTGNADAGFVPISLAKPAKMPLVIVRQDSYTPIEQWMAVVKKSKQKRAARLFIRFLEGPTAQKILAEYGFLPAEEKK